MSALQKKTQKATQQLTPMMAQYMEIKAANTDNMLFYRMGDFYELFFDDAEHASRVLGIQLTKRGQLDGKDIPMAGVPVHSANDYLQRLIRAGFRVAVCEQMEDPAEAKKRGHKAVVRRDVVRLVTPGTLTEDTLLEAGQHNFLTAVFQFGVSSLNGHSETSSKTAQYALASVDISTGEFLISQVNETDLAGEIIRLNPSEILMPDTFVNHSILQDCAEQLKTSITPVPDAYFNSATGEHDLKAALNVSALEGYGAFSKLELASIGAILKYIELTQIGKKPVLRSPKRHGANEILVIDAATRINLELIQTTSGEKEGSLFGAINRTVTGPGSRQLSAWISSPLQNVTAISRRLESVDFFKSNETLRVHIRKSLKGSPDLARALSRLVLDRGGPRDLAAIHGTLEKAIDISGYIANIKALVSPPELVGHISGMLERAQSPLADTLKRALADELPAVKNAGDFIRQGFSNDLDEARMLRDDSRKIIASLQQRYADETGVKALKIRHNNMLGYFIEASTNNAKPLMIDPFDKTFIHRQTLANAMRFTTLELGEIENRINMASEQVMKLEQDIFLNLIEQVVDQEETLIGISESLADLDVYCALAELAEEQNYVRPVVNNSTHFEITGGRHPVIDIVLQKNKDSAFIENDCILNASEQDDLQDTHAQKNEDAGRLWVITGPNMAGKSTFLRQNALIALMAQVGSFVPAKRAHIGVVDRLFSRVGASDDLARGRSTFMVEMVETAAILNQATDRSLVILDEIGRGTATFDGLSIAWATVEYLHDVCQSRTLFATHYHELTALSEQLDQVVNATTQVKEWQDQIVFLYKIVLGAADRSYGIQVAKLAGLPQCVIARAGEVLKILEDHDHRETKQNLIQDLPLFAAVRPQSVGATHDPVSQHINKIEQELEQINPDMLSPKEALDVLYRLKSF
ncbi:MAG: DNA mismatch repair protein MutS [Pseudomonadota bacterium]